MSDRRVSREYNRASEALGRKVQALRESRGLTQEQLSEVTGISRNQIQNIERNRNNSRDPETGRPGPGNPRLDTVFLLAEALWVEVTYLIDPNQPLNPLPAAPSTQ